MCSLAGCLLRYLRNLMPNAFNKPRRPRYALSMTVLRCVIAVTTDKNKGIIPPLVIATPPLCTSAMRLRKSAHSFDIESDPRCIDVYSNKISLGLRSLGYTSPGYLPTFSRHSLAAPRCKSDASPEVDNFLLNASHIHVRKTCIHKKS